MATVFTLLLFSSILFLTNQQNTAVYPSRMQDQKLATQINCQTDEIRHYKYNSVVSLWGDIDGRIAVVADLAVSCLGDDTGGNYGPEALKYRAEITSLRIEENQSKEDTTLKRKRRGIGEFFSNAWRKVKNFFISLFGGTPEEEERQNRPSQPEIENRNQPPPTTPETSTQNANEGTEEEEVYEYGSLYREPFEFVQMANGSIPDIRFTQADEDNRIRNFKRHLVDAFASQLSLKSHHAVVVEKSVMGEHLSNYNISMGGVASALAFGEGERDTYHPEIAEENQTIVVKKLVTQNDILNLAPSSETVAINDLDKVELSSRQTQIFSKGKLVSISGSSSLLLFQDGSKKRREKRESQESVLTYFQAHSNYDIQFSRLQRRSVDNFMSAKLQDKNLVFSSASRAAELEETSAKQRLEDLQKYIGDPKIFVEALVQNVRQNGNNDDDDEKTQIMFEIVQQEVIYGLDHQPLSLAGEIRRSFSKEVLNKVCFEKFKKCIDLLQLLARAGGSEAETVLISYINDESSGLPARREIADLLSDISNPSPKIIDELVKMLTLNHLDPRLLGSLAIGASNLAVAAKGEQKRSLVDALINLLDASWSPVEQTTDPLTIDLLEALGNVGDPTSTTKVLQVCSGNSSDVSVHIACAAALRYLSHLPSVQAWMEDMILSGSCDVTYAIIGSLLDKIHKQELSGDQKSWPRVDFNEIDRLIKKKLEKTSPDTKCSSVEVAAVRYFRRKKNAEAEEFASNYFTSDSQPFQDGSRTRQKRSLSEDINCGEWTVDDKFTPQQEKDEFASDLITYNKRKSCFASRKLGLPGASSDIYAGMFAGVKQPSDPPKYKLFTKFVSGVNFLGHEMEIGSFYFYHHSGYTKAYVRVLGKTRQEFQHNGCIPSELRYRPITHIPLYQVRISVVQLSLGIHLSSELQVETLCPKEEEYDFKPLSNIRVGGEAMGTVLFARGAINLGGNFNYFLQFSFNPTPDMCLNGQHGYNPMTVGIEAYYQFWNVAKLKWGKARTWKPSSLMWQINDGDKQLWFNDTCMLKDVSTDARTATPVPTITTPIPRTSTSIPATTSPIPSNNAAEPAPSRPNDDNEILVVRA